jgi:chaperonin GroES
MIEPLKGYIVVKMIIKNTKTKSGLELPEEIAKDISLEAEVVAVGKSIVRDGEVEMSQVSVGDKVLYRPFTGVKYGEFLILHFSELVAIIK